MAAGYTTRAPRVPSVLYTPLRASPTAKQQITLQRNMLMSVKITFLVKNSYVWDIIQLFRVLQKAV